MHGVQRFSIGRLDVVRRQPGLGIGDLKPPEQLGDVQRRLRRHRQFRQDSEGLELLRCGTVRLDLVDGFPQLSQQPLPLLGREQGVSGGQGLVAQHAGMDGCVERVSG